MAKMILVAAQGFELDLKTEIERKKNTKLLRNWQRLFEVESDDCEWAWTQNIWTEPELINFDSVSKAAVALREKNRFWALHSTHHHRRAELIQAQLQPWSPKKIEFLQSLNFPKLGAWTLLEPNLLLASAKTVSPFADGEFEFNEDKANSPSRAYLKLWELFTLTGHHPKQGEKCLDLGSSPGGWTWVLSELGCDVISVDKAALDSKLKSPLIQHLKKDAFSLKPTDIGPVDWLFSDLICYPPKLLELVTQWLESGLVKNFVCTIKFQGETDFITLEKFKQIPKSKTRHLHHNKHELTWWLIKNPIEG